MCEEEPKALSDDFFNDNQPEYDLSIYDNWVVATTPVKLEKFMPSEVQARLSNAENSSPGLERLTYDNWRSVEYEGNTLATIFYICTKYRKILDVRSCCPGNS